MIWQEVCPYQGVRTLSTHKIAVGFALLNEHVNIILCSKIWQFMQEYAM